jgi:ADP-ribose pyrophosphatase
MTQKAKIRADLEAKATAQRVCIHQGKVISFVEDQITYPNGEKKRFDLVLHPGAVAMIPINDEGNLIFVKQWRRAAKKILLELPAGTLEEGEDPVVCAQRELQEEIGYKPRSLTFLGGFFTAPGFCTEYIYLYLAKDLHPDPLIGDDADEIDLVTLTIEEALEAIKKEEIIDIKTIAGICRYQLGI